MNITTTVKQEIVQGSLVKIKGLFNDWIVVNIHTEVSEDRIRKESYSRTIMECINTNELKLSNPKVYKFNIKDLGSMSGEREILSSDISVVGFKKIVKIVDVKYTPV